MNIFTWFWYGWMVVFICIGLFNYLGTPTAWHIKNRVEHLYYATREFYLISCVVNVLLALILIMVTFEGELHGQITTALCK